MARMWMHASVKPGDAPTPSTSKKPHDPHKPAHAGGAHPHPH